MLVVPWLVIATWALCSHKLGHLYSVVSQKVIINYIVNYIKFHVFFFFLFLLFVQNYLVSFLLQSSTTFKSIKSKLASNQNFLVIIKAMLLQWTWQVFSRTNFDDEGIYVFCTYLEHCDLGGQCCCLTLRGLYFSLQLTCIPYFPLLWMEWNQSLGLLFLWDLTPGPNYQKKNQI